MIERRYMLKTVYNLNDSNKEEITSRDYFYFREILLGMREEYKKNQQILEELTHLVEVRGDYRPSDFIFSLYQNDCFPDELSKSIIYCDFYRRKTNFQKLISLFQDVTGLSHPDFGACVKDKNGKYHLDYTRDSVRIKDGKNDEFDIIAQKILNTEYAQKAATGEILLPDGKLDIGHRCICLNQNFSDTHHQDTEYYLPTDTMYLYNVEICLDKYDKRSDCYYSNLQISNEFVNEKMIQSVLNQKIEKSKIPLYHQKIFENNSNTGKILTFHDNSQIKACKVKIEENANEIAFQKIKYRSFSDF